MTTALPSSIGSYSIQDLLGVGGMGRIYLAVDGLGKQVALKVLLPELTAATLDRLRFEREFDIASGLSHPNLVPVFERSFAEHLCYYSMEYVAGSDLARHFSGGDGSREHGRSILMAFAELTECLGYLHGHGIVHRDLKSENVLIDPTGRLRLLDFGLACFKRFTSTAQRLTSPGVVLGTPYTMAPEQILGDDADERSDLYAVGVMLFQLFCQRMPFEAPDPMAVLYQILHQPIPEFVPRVAAPSGLAALVAQLLDKQPHNRPSDAGEVCARLRQMADHWSEGEETPAAAETPAEPEQLRKLHAPRFVGRIAEQNWLDEKLERLLTGLGCWTLLSGPSGVGKSHLLQHWAGLAKARNVQVVRTSPVAGSPIPYQLWTPILRWALHDGPVPQSVLPFVPALSMLLPELDVRRDGGPAWDDPLQRYHLFEGMGRLILHRCAHQPTLLLLDQVHEADAASQEFLCYLLETRFYSQDGLKLPLLAVAGSDEGGTLEALKRLAEAQPNGHQFVLPSLTLAEAGLFLEGLLDGQPVDPESVRYLYQESEGKPLFLQEVARFGLERQAWNWRAGAWHYLVQTSNTAHSGGLHLPARLQAAIRQRLSTLDATVADVLRVGALLGSLLQFRHLQALCSLPDRALYDICAQLVARRLFAERADFELASQTVAELTLESIDWNARRAYHARIAAYLESWATPPWWDVAQHWTGAGEAARAGTAYLTQAHEALRSYAYEEACRCLQEISHLPREAQPLAGAELDELWADALLGAGRSLPAIDKLRPLVEAARSGLERVRRQRKLAAALEMVGSLTEASLANRDGLKALAKLRGLTGTAAQEAVIEGHKLCERQTRVLFLLRSDGWVDEFARLTVSQLRFAMKRAGDRAERQETWAQMFLYTGFWSMRKLQWFGGARFGFRTALERATDLPETVAKSNLLRDIGYLYFLAGSTRRARRLLGDARDLALRLGDLSGMCKTAMQLHAVCFYRGYIGESLTHAQTALQQAQRIHNGFEESMAVCHIVKAMVILGDLAGAEKLLGRVPARAAGDSTTLLDLLYQMSRAYCACAGGRLAEAVDISLTMFRLCQRQGELPVMTLHFGLLLLEARLDSAQAVIPLGADCLAELPLAIVELLKELAASTSSQRLYRPWLQRLQARAAMLEGKRGAALNLLSDACRKAEQDGLPYERFRCHLLLAEWLQEQGVESYHLRQAQLAEEDCRSANS